ncbi:MAG: hypothetical protein OEY52_17090 [Gammaproteobacteria bacterium]|nr:hypothetical protein [Gammaproteobacteria bacterium]
MRREDWELRDQQHLMDAEGCHSERPTTREIVKALEEEGYRPSNLDISFDTMQGLWRWHCYLLKIHSDHIGDV